MARLHAFTLGSQQISHAPNLTGSLQKTLNHRDLLLFRQNVTRRVQYCRTTICYGFPFNIWVHNSACEYANRCWRYVKLIRIRSKSFLSLSVPGTNVEMTYVAIGVLFLRSKVSFRYSLRLHNFGSMAALPPLPACPFKLHQTAAHKLSKTC